MATNLRSSRADDRGLVSVAEAARLAGVSAATVYRWIREGSLPSIAFGGGPQQLSQILIPREALGQHRPPRSPRRRKGGR
jgi:excisionase family DNA binding protein